MAYIAGRPLEEQIDPENHIPQSRVAELVYKIALALEHAHRKGIIHRDLKPANIMISTDDEPVIMDFGLAKRTTSIDSNEAKLTRSGGIIGTPSYMSPEQVKGDDKSTGPTTDVYSLGVILFELLTGHTPYRGNVGVVLGQILAAAVPPVKEFRSDVDPRLDEICQKAMAKEPSSRFQSMREFADVLAPFAAIEGVSPRRSAEIPSSTISPLEENRNPLLAEFARFADAPAKKTTEKGRRPSKWRVNAGTLAGVAIIACVLITLLMVNPPVSKSTRTVPVNSSASKQSSSVASPIPSVAAESEVEEKPQPSSLGTAFVLISKGKSWLGGASGRPGKVEVEILEDFYLGATEVTQGEWEQIMGRNPSYFARRGDGKDAVQSISDDDLKRCPVEMVSWKECQEFIRRLNKKERAAGWRYRLPTEAEWEYACRGGPLSDVSDSAFSFYFEPPGNALLPEQASVGGREKRTSQVGVYQAGRLGLYNMHDNVHEWCADDVPRPKDSPGEMQRIIRGGSWWSPPAFCQAIARFIEEPGSQRYNIGLRLARTRSAF
jgi:formylglycine-generating enzyme required for sulfatase activity